jgi:hypothetical protein
MNKLTHALLLAGVVTIGASTAVFAADEPAPAAPAPAKPTAPSLGDVLDASGLTATGYLDVAFSHLSGGGAFTSGVPDRVFDADGKNSFQVHQAAITIAKQPKEGFGALINLTAGDDADVIHSFDQTTSKFDVTQAFLQYATGPLTIIGGKYVTLAGAEVIATPGNTNFSRSILFGYAIPFAHTGVRATFALNDQFSLIAGVNNGWDQLKDTNKQKTGELGISFTPVKEFVLTAQGYSGNEVTALGNGRRDLIDLVATFNASDALSFVLNYDYGNQDNFASLVDGSSIKAKWTGLAAYVNFQLSEQWRLSVRGEYFDDKDGARTGVVDSSGAGQKWKEGTVTLAYLPTKNAELRAEFRYDTSNKQAFLESDGVTAKDTQNSFALQGIYKF